VIKIDIKFGSVEPQTDYRLEGGAMVCYSRAIHRDINGTVEKITEWEPLSKISNWTDVYGARSFDDVSREPMP